jgi:hypothetical protein
MKAALFLNTLMLAGMGNVVADIFAYLSWEAVSRVCIACPNATAFSIIKRNLKLLKTVCWRNAEFLPEFLHCSNAHASNCRINIAYLATTMETPEQFYLEYLTLSRSENNWKLDIIPIIPSIRKLTTGYQSSFEPYRILFNPLFDIVAFQHSAKHIEIYR